MIQKLSFYWISNFDTRLTDQWWSHSITERTERTELWTFVTFMHINIITSIVVHVTCYVSSSTFEVLLMWSVWIYALTKFSTKWLSLIYYSIITISITNLYYKKIIEVYELICKWSTMSKSMGGPSLKVNHQMCIINIFRS